MIILKKKTIYNILFSIALVFSVSSFLNVNEHKNSFVFAPLSAGKTIIIDAGHGYPDGGAIAGDGTLEKDINLEISKKLGMFFVQSGAKVIYTREGDDSVAEKDNKTIRDIKRDDLKSRRETLNSGEGDIFLSIHMNNFDDSKYSGAQVFYDGNNKDSKVLANLVQSYLKEFVDKTNTRKAKDAKNSIFIMRDSKIPCALIECGFLSNKKELEKLKSEEYQEELSYAIFCAVTEYIQNNM
ncbi:MAG: N-acetylmuramoyl-L-alanine amidase CwlD [Ruminococcaceae bacterium]|nr:N-acetylmuramoyl-L-alanine amidase CwlD [Oscillospiraceae bacterium]